MKNLKSKLKTGFALLLSLIVTSILLTVGLGVSEIMFKETKLSGLGQESQIAFYAADAGIECSLFWDKKDYFSTTDNKVGSVVCGGTGGVSSPSFVSSTGKSSFSLTLGSDPDKKCAKVEVTKTGSITTVESKGYNTACDSTSPFKVERAIRISSLP